MNYTNDPSDGYGVNVSALSAADQAGLDAKKSAEIPSSDYFKPIT